VVVLKANLLTKRGTVPIFQELLKWKRPQRRLSVCIGSDIVLC
jgi:hypothetical protein